MRWFRRIVSAGLAGMMISGTSLAATRYVNATNPTPAAPYAGWSTAATNIQAAINAAANGDEIQVAPGTYRIAASVTIPGSKALTLRSTQSRAAVIDAQRLCPAVSIESANSVVEGFAIRNGISPVFGGGLSVQSASTVRDCLVTGNQANGGAGIVVYGRSLIENCTVQSNLAESIGGGILLYNHSSGTVSRCQILDNVASNWGGGLYIQFEGSASNSWIAGNRTLTDGGGGVYMAQGGGRLVNSVIVANRAQVDGGGVACFEGYLAHCTVVSNTAGGWGGGLYTSSAATWNSIIYSNAAASYLNMFRMPAADVFENNCITPDETGSNFTNAPAFVDFAARDFHLAAGSSCLERGATNPAIATDYDGISRPQQSTVAGVAEYDVGAFEYQMEICDGLDNDHDGQIDENCRTFQTCFSLNQTVACAGEGWTRAYIMDLTNFRNIAVQDGYQSFTVAYALFYNIWTGLYLYDYTAGAFSTLTWLTNLDL